MTRNRTMQSLDINVDTRSRGSLLVLVMVVLVVMVFLGTAYVQVARVDRDGLDQDSTAELYLDEVVEASIANIMDTLRNDITNGEDNYDYPYTSPFNPGADDDMWLAATAPEVRHFRNKQFLTHWKQISILGNFPGDERVDAYVMDKNPVWEDVKNKYIFMKPAQLLDPTDSYQSYKPYKLNENCYLSWLSSGYFNGSKNFGSIGHDVDGDGQEDSVWMRAPIPQMGTMEYYWAVRIIDNSSKINIQTATKLTDDLYTPINVNDEITRPRGLYPTEVDLSRLLSRQWIGDQLGHSWENQLNNYIGERNQTSLNSGDLPEYGNPDSIVWDSRLGRWFNSGIYFDRSPQLYLGETEELFLVNKNGLAVNTEDNLLLDNLGVLLRKREMPYPSDDEEDYKYSYATFVGSIPDGTLRDHYNAVVNNTPYPVTKEELERRAYFLGTVHRDAYFGSGITPDDPDIRVGFRAYPAINHMLTAYSGAMPMEDFTSGSINWKDSIRIPTAEALAGRITLLGNRIYREFRDGADELPRSTADPQIESNAYLGIGTAQTTPPAAATGPQYYDNDAGLDELYRLSFQYSLCVADYLDSGGRPSEWVYPDGDTDAIRYYGMEALPFVSEVYIELGYEDVDNQMDDDPLTAAIVEGERVDYVPPTAFPGDGRNDYWVAMFGQLNEEYGIAAADIKDTRAMAIELVNPFNADMTINTSSKGEPDTNGSMQCLRIIVTDNAPGGNSYTLRLDKDDFEIFTDAVAFDRGGGSPNDPNSVDLPDGDKIIIYYNPEDGLREDSYGSPSRALGEDDLAAGLFLDQELGSTVAALFRVKINSDRFLYTIDGSATGSTPAFKIEDMIFELQILTNAGDDGVYDTADDIWVTYDRVEPSSNTLEITGADLLYKRKYDDPAQTSASKNYSHLQGAWARADEYFIQQVTNRWNNRISDDIRRPSDDTYAEHENSTILTYRFYDSTDQDGTGNMGNPRGPSNTDERFLLGRDIDKDVTPPTPPGGVDLWQRDFRIPLRNDDLLSVSELALIHMFGFYYDPSNLDEGSLPWRLEQQTEHDIANLSDSLIHARHFLDLRNNPNDDDLIIPRATMLPHAATLLGRFSTFFTGPASANLGDGNDNDGRGFDGIFVDDDREGIVPGLININTAPLHIATLACPTPLPVSGTNNAMEEYFRAIYAYRDVKLLDINRTPMDYDDDVPVRPVHANMSTAPDSPLGTHYSGFQQDTSATSPMWDDKPGIKNIAELLYVNPFPDDPDDSSDVQRYFDNGYNMYTDGLRIYNNLELGSSMPANGQTGRMAIYQYLSNVFTTRSDVYTAYVEIRGFDVNDYEYGAKEVAKFVVVLDRSTVKKADDPVRILAYKRIE